MNDIEIAQNAYLDSIDQIGKKVGLTENELEMYGKYKAKVNVIEKHRLNSKLVLVTAVNPTPAGEGKSTVTIGLGDALSQLGKKTMICLREPSLGPVMGIKGGATGGGYSQVVPMEDINLHFTGDMHALTSANNTLAAMIDNHIYQGNELQIDPRRILWKRVLDINDRALRHTVIGLGGPTQGIPREDGFDITVASELMAVLCLAADLDDLKQRISRIVIGYSYQRKPITVEDLGVTDAIALLLKDAIKPNLVQTLEHTPALVHGGPFANIAHGCNSVIATKTSLQLADYTITEAGFGADLGAEKFLDIVCPQLEKTPDTIVIVATARALKMNGGVSKEQLDVENVAAVQKGYSNLQRHIKNMKRYGVPVIVAINRFATDSDAELNEIIRLCRQNDQTQAIVTNGWAEGGKGVIDLANAVISNCNQEKHFNPLYDNQATIKEKIEILVKEIYGGKNVEYSNKAQKQIKTFEKLGWDKMPICMAKTPYSFSDDAKLLGAPSGFTIHIREFVPKLGAGFLVALTGNVLTMPGLPKVPAANGMKISNDGRISGLY
ncbi:MAG TPA: formate--tetrahydrofolate ligase [Candidatus Ligilactobacillus excrementigallinarum]|uniref:Formate--tetrahydrofolate ligase n=1 Tax=Candidatus Ligilactobacillus excrementigallinarum TaxID=2838641 RepID=A0A9D1UXV2_9LACO|nr:formate--tetrahydrofolate ligase [Candidatus Ligilactobacillus excrementigallinarum]